MTVSSVNRRKTIVYVDGFNLYYGALAHSRYKWLDLLTLSKRLLTQNDIVQVKYFTALVKPRPNNPGQNVRQQMYLRALKTLTCIEIHFGHFLSHPVWMPLVQPLPGRSSAEVIKTEEKGSDVNLASHLLMDGFKGRYEVAAVITNDSDLVMPIHMARSELRKTVGILNPHAANLRSRPSNELRKIASFYKPIEEATLAASQFPDSMTDANGMFHRPSSWR
jgi:hypothetical protein